MTNQVEYRKLGSSGLLVSVPILGAMAFGDVRWMVSRPWYFLINKSIYHEHDLEKPWILDEEGSMALLKAAWDRGINTIDTANMYSNGESERIIGRFIQRFNIPRSQIIVATKCSLLVGNAPELFAYLDPKLSQTREYVNQSGLSRAAIFNAVDASLERLQTSYIDLLQIHRFDRDTPAEETMKALHDLVQNGKVRYLGASSMRCWEFAYLKEVAGRNGWTKFISMQNEYSLLYREEEREMLAYCKFNGIGVIPWGALNCGSLCRPVGLDTPRLEYFRGTRHERILTDVDKDIVSRVEELAKNKGKTMTQISLAWVQSKITSPIVGITSREALDDDIVCAMELTNDEILFLEELYVPKPVQGHL